MAPHTNRTRHRKASSGQAKPRVPRGQTAGSDTPILPSTSPHLDLDQDGIPPIPRTFDLMGSSSSKTKSAPDSAPTRSGPLPSSTESSSSSTSSSSSSASKKELPPPQVRSNQRFEMPSGSSSLLFCLPPSWDGFSSSGTVEEGFLVVFKAGTYLIPPFTDFGTSKMEQVKLDHDRKVYLSKSAFDSLRQQHGNDRIILYSEYSILGENSPSILDMKPNILSPGLSQLHRDIFTLDELSIALYAYKHFKRSHSSQKLNSTLPVSSTPIPPGYASSLFHLFGSSTTAIYGEVGPASDEILSEKDRRKADEEAWKRWRQAWVRDLVERGFGSGGWMRKRLDEWVLEEEKKEKEGKGRKGVYRGKMTMARVLDQNINDVRALRTFLAEGSTFGVKSPVLYKDCLSLFQCAIIHTLDPTGHTLSESGPHYLLLREKVNHMKEYGKALTSIQGTGSFVKVKDLPDDEYEDWLEGDWVEIRELSKVELKEYKYFADWFLKKMLGRKGSKVRKGMKDEVYETWLLGGGDRGVVVKPEMTSIPQIGKKEAVNPKKDAESAQSNPCVFDTLKAGGKLKATIMGQSGTVYDATLTPMEDLLKSEGKENEMKKKKKKKSKKKKSRKNADSVDIISEDESAEQTVQLLQQPSRPVSTEGHPKLSDPLTFPKETINAELKELQDRMRDLEKLRETQEKRAEFFKTALEAKNVTDDTAPKSSHISTDGGSKFQDGKANIKTNHGVKLKISATGIAATCAVSPSTPQTSLDDNPSFASKSATSVIADTSAVKSPASSSTFSFAPFSLGTAGTILDQPSGIDTSKPRPGWKSSPSSGPLDPKLRMSNDQSGSRSGDEGKAIADAVSQNLTRNCRMCPASWHYTQNTAMKHILDDVVNKETLKTLVKESAAVASLSAKVYDTLSIQDIHDAIRGSTIKPPTDLSPPVAFLRERLLARLVFQGKLECYECRDQPLLPRILSQKHVIDSKAAVPDEPLVDESAKLKNASRPSIKPAQAQFRSYREPRISRGTDSIEHVGSDSSSCPQSKTEATSQTRSKQSSTSTKGLPPPNLPARPGFFRPTSGALSSDIIYKLYKRYFEFYNWQFPIADSAWYDPQGVLQTAVCAVASQSGDLIDAKTRSGLEDDCRGLCATFLQNPFHPDNDGVSQIPPTQLDWSKGLQIDVYFLQGIMIIVNFLGAKLLCGTDSLLRLMLEKMAEICKAWKMDRVYSSNKQEETLSPSRSIPRSAQYQQSKTILGPSQPRRDVQLRQKKGRVLRALTGAQRIAVSDAMHLLPYDSPVQDRVDAIIERGVFEAESGTGVKMKRGTAFDPEKLSEHVWIRLYNLLVRDASSDKSPSGQARGPKDGSEGRSLTSKRQDRSAGVPDDIAPIEKKKTAAVLDDRLRSAIHLHHLYLQLHYRLVDLPSITDMTIRQDFETRRLEIAKAPSPSLLQSDRGECMLAEMEIMWAGKVAARSLIELASSNASLIKQALGPDKVSPQDLQHRIKQEDRDGGLDGILKHFTSSVEGALFATSRRDILLTCSRDRRNGKPSGGERDLQMAQLKMRSFLEQATIFALGLNLLSSAPRIASLATTRGRMSQLHLDLNTAYDGCMKVFFQEILVKSQHFYLADATFQAMFDLSIAVWSMREHPIALPQTIVVLKENNFPRRLGRLVASMKDHGREKLRAWGKKFEEELFRLDRDSEKFEEGKTKVKTPLNSTPTSNAVRKKAEEPESGKGKGKGGLLASMRDPLKMMRDITNPFSKQATAVELGGMISKGSDREMMVRKTQKERDKENEKMEKPMKEQKDTKTKDGDAVPAQAPVPTPKRPSMNELD